MSVDTGWTSVQVILDHVLQETNVASISRVSIIQRVCFYQASGVRLILRTFAVTPILRTISCVSCMSIRKYLKELNKSIRCFYLNKSSRFGYSHDRRGSKNWSNSSKCSSSAINFVVKAIWSKTSARVFEGNSDLTKSFESSHNLHFNSGLSWRRKKFRGSKFSNYLKE